MDRELKFIMKITIFFVFFCLSTDISKLRETKEIIKDCLDLSTKAATLQIDTNSGLISEGIFQIDEIKSRQAFLQTMALNSGISTDIINNCMIEYKAINAPGTYINPVTLRSYTIERPTFIAAMRFQFKGLLIKKEIIISNNFAGSELRKR